MVLAVFSFLRFTELSVLILVLPRLIRNTSNLLPECRARITSLKVFSSITSCLVNNEALLAAFNGYFQICMW